MITRVRMRGAPVLRALLIVGVLACGLHAVPVFTLMPPGGAVSGSPGSTVGWSFTLSNSPDWLVVTNSAFCSGTGHTAADIGTAACTTAYAAVGTYTDYIAATFSSGSLAIGLPNPPDPNGGPTDSPLLMQTFDGVSMGVGQFVINPSASGQVSGELLLTYDLFSRSPNNAGFNPDTDLISTDNFFHPAASVTVVPEPATLLLMACGLGALGFRRFRLRRF
jgi:hypothetical protein